MKTEYKILIYSIINNLVISIIKVASALIFNINSLLADGLQTFSDLITDIISMFTNRLSKKRPNKNHPFGFGKSEYLSNLFGGIILLFLSIFIIISSFFKEASVPSIKLLYILVFVIILKLIAIIIMHHMGTKINSQILINSEQESKLDLYSSISVAVVIILLQYSKNIKVLKYSDVVASIIIGIIIFRTAINIIRDNSLLLIGETEKDPKIIKELEDFIFNFDDIKHLKLFLNKNGSYYHLQLTIEVNPKLSLRQVINLENKIKYSILNNKSFKIKYISIYVTNTLD